MSFVEDMIQTFWLTFFRITVYRAQLADMIHLYLIKVEVYFKLNKQISRLVVNLSEKQLSYF